MTHDVLAYGRVRRICPDGQRPEDLKVTCRLCGSEYPRPTTLAQAVQLAVGMPVALIVVLTALLLASLMWNYGFFPMRTLIVRL
jgi:hypothetical protein